jgi:hypothetical protein
MAMHEREDRPSASSASHVPPLAELQEQVTELLEQRAAISEVLHAIASSPHELQPVFDAILVSATRLCRAVTGGFRLREDKGFRLVALKGASEALQRRSPPTLLENSSVLGLLAANKSPIHIPDLAAHDSSARVTLSLSIWWTGGFEDSCKRRCSWMGWL